MFRQQPFLYALHQYGFVRFLKQMLSRKLEQWK